MSESLLKIAGSDDAAVSPRSVALTGRWLPLQLAADRAGLKNVGALRRRVMEEQWESRGLARLVRQPSGQAAYEVDEGADPRFAAVKSAETLTDSFRSSREFLALSQVIRDRALLRESLLRQWQTRVSGGRAARLAETLVTKRFCLEQKALGVDVSRTQLFEWRKADQTGGLKGLVDRWGKRESVDASQFWHVGSEAWLHTSRRSKQLCFDTAVNQAEQHGWEHMSYRDFCRKLDAIPAGVRIKRREGGDAFVLQAEPSIARDYTTIASNDWWCSDDHTFDVMALHEGRPVRPVLHAWQDLRSRKIVGWVILPHAPRAGDVLRTFVTAVRTHGVPAHVLVDNGKHFDSRALQGVTKQQRRRGLRPSDLTPAELARVGGAFNTLGCQVHHATPYHGQSKPIERFFGTICRRFATLWETYTGNSPDNKPGKGRGTTALQRAIDRGDVPTVDQLTQAFEQWLAVDYNGKPGHAGDGMGGRSPDAAYADELAGSVRTLPDHILEFATFERVGPVTVHKNGVTWKTLQYGWADEQLIARLGRKVLLAIDERDARHVYVLDVNGALVCRAAANQRLPHGANKRMIDAAASAKRRASKAVAEFNKQRPRLTMDRAELAFAVDGERRAAESPAKPPPLPAMKIVRTAFDADSAAIANAMRPKLLTVDKPTPADAVEGISMSQLMGSRPEVTDELD